VFQLNCSRMLLFGQAIDLVIALRNSRCTCRRRLTKMYEGVSSGGEGGFNYASDDVVVGNLHAMREESERERERERECA